MDTKWLDSSYFDVTANELIASLPRLTNQRKKERESVCEWERERERDDEGVKIQDVRMKEDGCSYLKNW